MQLFIMNHTWKKENTKIVSKKVIEALANPPEGSTILNSYLRADLTGAVCIWQAKSVDQIQDWIRGMVPEMGTDAVPALQFFPPGPDIYPIIHTLIGL
jgi:hypothetical protein